MMNSDSGVATAIDDKLEAQYALRKRHPERDDIYRDHLQRSAALRAADDCRLDVRYADGPRCLLDVFPAGAGAPVLFFIHGGYWRALNKSYVSFIAEAYRDAGITVVMPGYDLVPAVRVGGIVDQIRAAFAWTLSNLTPTRVVVSGHSAGGQLAAMLALDQAARGEGTIAGLAGVSGVFDLRPLLKTSINGDLMLSAQDAAEASPRIRLAQLPAGAPLVPLLGVVGGDETDGFKEWTVDFVRDWKTRGAKADYCEIARSNHFSVLDHVADAQGEVFRGIAAMIG